MICHECGNDTVKLISISGRFMRYRDVPAAEIPSDIEIPTCTTCGAEWLDEDLVETIDGRLERIHGRYSDREEGSND